MFIIEMYRVVFSRNNYFFRSFLFLRFAFIINDPAMLPVNYFGILLNVLYVLVYAYYEPKKVGNSCVFNFQFTLK